MAVIFDLDQTLVDTQSVQSLRDSRQWKLIYNMVNQLPVYENIHQLIDLLNDNNIKIAIVTKSPRPYCEAIIKQWKWKVDVTVCYHDCRNQKPNREPIDKAVELLKVDRNNIISIGDTKEDIIASNDANVFSIASTWGTLDKGLLISSKPKFIVDTVPQLIQFVKERYTIL